jgi:hypothetical protein
MVFAGKATGNLKRRTHKNISGKELLAWSR